MVNVLGALIIIFGFLSHFILLPRGITIPSTILFCVGFLLLFKSNKKLTKVSALLKWGQIGVLVNLLGFLLLLLSAILVLNTSLSDTKFGYVFLSGIRWIIMPITALSEVFSPYEQIIMPGGIIGGKLSFLRWNLASFFNVFFYAVFAIVIGKLVSTVKLKKHQPM